jgi:transcriptional regulator with XRE-family HTH domain
MTNHPGRKPGRAQQRMTPEALRDLIERAGITQERAADLAGVETRTMERWIAGTRAMPLSASGLLAVSCIMLGSPVGIMAPYLSSEVRALLDQRA